MELWLILLALWAFECLGFVPPGGASVTWSRTGARIRARAGLALSSPWPGRLAAVLDGIPFEVTRTRVSAHGALRLFAATAGMEEERTAPLGDARPEAVGAQVRTRVGPLLRASSDSAAARIAGWLAALDAAAAEERPARFLALWRAALQLEGVRVEVARVARLTRLHRLLGALSLSVIALGLPGLALGTRAGFGAAWDLAWPALLGLHGLGWLALLYAESKRRAPGRALRLFRAFVYPPTLWRGSFELASAGLGDRHPLALAAALLERDALEPLARRALAECAWPPFERGGRPVPPDVDERREALAARRVLLLGLFAEAGLPEERLLAAPRPRTLHAASYCPICQTEFVVGAWVCPDCRIEARAF